MNGIIRGVKIVIAATAMKSVKGAEKDTRVERMKIDSLSFLLGVITGVCIVVILI